MDAFEKIKDVVLENADNEEVTMDDDAFQFQFNVMNEEKSTMNGIGRSSVKEEIEEDEDEIMNFNAMRAFLGQGRTS